MTLKITLSLAEPLQTKTDVVAVGAVEGTFNRPTTQCGRVLQALGEALGPTVNRAIKRSDFTGKPGQTVEFATAGLLNASRVLLIGLGKPETLKAPAVRTMAAKVARHAGGCQATSLAIALPEDLPAAVRQAAEGAVLGAYRFERFKTGDRMTKFPLKQVQLLIQTKPTAELRSQAATGQRVGEAVCLARDLINTPPNELYPESLADYALQVCEKGEGLSCTVLDHQAIKKKGLNLLSAVGQGSARPPRLIHMTYQPPKLSKQELKSLKKLVFVGKGLTFDTGGICLKPAAGMEEMKGDMGGAANIVALMAAVAVTKPEAVVHGIIASAENMPGANAYRPGDIFTSYEGKTVEVINTDAEGRLALADALAYGRELKPDFMLDNATLTGACVVALGPTVSGFYTNRDELTELMKQSADAAGEAMWHLPLVEDLREMLKSDWADLKHMGDRWGGSITAALFLREFVGEVPWVHCDIAGPSMASKAYDVFAKGGTGHGVLTFLELINALLKPAAKQAAGAQADGR